MRHQSSQTQGFTLIELSIVLVIIGLIVGGILTGRDLIAASQVRATISQIEGYNTAANTFYGKYGFLPGDIPDPTASSFGFAARGSTRGEGDGNGILEGLGNPYYTASGIGQLGGETAMFWVDLSAAHLIPESFTTASATASLPLTTSPNLLFPPAKLGQSNYIAVGSNGSGLTGTWVSTAMNVFALQMYSNGATSTGLTVQQAYGIDRKIDDGFPLAGRVQAYYYNGALYPYSVIGAAGGGGAGGLAGTSIPGSASTCYDNGGSSSAIINYSVKQSGGNNVNCALLLQLQ